MRILYHVLLPTREAAPVGEYDEREAFTLEVEDSLRGLVCRVRIPYLTSLHEALLE